MLRHTHRIFKRYSLAIERIDRSRAPIKRRPDNDGMSAHPNPRAEKVPTRAVASGELSLLHPVPSGAREHVGCSCFVIPGTDICERSPGHDGVPFHGYRVTQPIAGRAIDHGELGLLFPTHASMHEHVGRPGRAAVVDGSDDDGVPIHGYGVAELVAARAIACGEFGLLLPARSAPGEHIGHSYPVVLEVRPGDDGIPAYRHDGAEDITGHAIIGIELRLSAMVIWVAR